jgi:LmbE family N-acetylglucosaminyl deacetylase
VICTQPRYDPGHSALYLLATQCWLKVMTKRLLLSLAHPDDESFGSGSLIAKYVAEGAEVTLICATNGDAGTVSPERLDGYKSVAELRLAELECASSVLGFKEVITFGYRDSNMMGHTDNENPKCLWQAPLEEVTARIVEVMRRTRPQVVLTFDPYGGYGHPDHIKMHQATMAAFHEVQSDPEHPQKLYYMAFPRAIIRIGVALMTLMRKDPRHVGVNKDMDMVAVLEATQPIHTRVNVGPYFDTGQRAADCHASQGNPRRMFPLAGLLMRRLAANTALTRAEPPVKPGEPVERDLFDGVTVR